MGISLSFGATSQRTTTTSPFDVIDLACLLDSKPLVSLPSVFGSASGNVCLSVVQVDVYMCNLCMYFGINVCVDLNVIINVLVCFCYKCMFFRVFVLFFIIYVY